MIKDLKICGISDPKTLNYIINHAYPPKFIGFITNFKKSKRFVDYGLLKKLLNVDKKNINFVSVLVNPNDEILEKIKDMKFDYYQLYNVAPKRTMEIKKKYKKKIISALTVFNKKDVDKYKKYQKISEIKGDYFIYDEKIHSLVGERSKKTYQLGDNVYVIVKKADLMKRQLDFILYEPKD